MVVQLISVADETAGRSAETAARSLPSSAGFLKPCYRHFSPAGSATRTVSRSMDEKKSVTARRHDFSTDMIEVSAHTPTATPAIASSERRRWRVMESQAKERMSHIAVPVRQT
jgi:hypothetical protein